MKKNRMLRMASALLVLTLLSTSVIGGTFAKYVTTDSGTDTARVAKFGVVATVSGDLFGYAYKNVANGNTIVSHDDSNATVNSDGVDNGKIVAPGTVNKTGLSFSVAGKPEVSTKVKLETVTDDDGKQYANSDIYLKAGNYGVMVKRDKSSVTDDNKTNYYSLNNDTYTKIGDSDTIPEKVYELCDSAEVSTGEVYYPLTWYVGDDVQAADSTNNKSGAQVAFETLRGKFKDGDNDKTFDPNTDLSDATKGLPAVTVGWEWKFEAGDDDAAKAANNAKDTILGDMIAAALATDPSYTVVLKDGDAYKKVNYKKELKDDGIANGITVAYTGSTEPNTSAADTICACLTASFNASITVEQVD